MNRPNHTIFFENSMYNMDEDEDTVIDSDDDDTVSMSINSSFNSLDTGF